MTTALPKLFGRRADVVVDTLRVSNLRIVFKITKSLKRTANKAEIRVFNLSPQHRDQLTQRRDVPVELSAGYEDRISLLYRGRMRTALPQREGTDIVMVITSEDGSHATQRARINQSFGAGTPVETVLNRVAGALGLDLGNSQQAFAGRAFGSMQAFSGGTTVSGNAAQELDRLTASAGLEWSVQDGVLQVLQLGQPLNTQAIVLSADSGLVGTPSLSSEGVLKAKSLLIPDLQPGRIVQMDAEFIRGNFRISKVEFSGDTANGDWYASIEGKAP